MSKDISPTHTNDASTSGDSGQTVPEPKFPLNTLNDLSHDVDSSVLHGQIANIVNESGDTGTTLKEPSRKIHPPLSKTYKRSAKLEWNASSVAPSAPSSAWDSLDDARENSQQSRTGLPSTLTGAPGESLVDSDLSCTLPSVDTSSTASRDVSAPSACATSSVGRDVASASAVAVVSAPSVLSQKRKASPPSYDSADKLHKRGDDIFYVDNSMYPKFMSGKDMPQNLLAEFSSSSSNLTRVKWCSGLFNHLVGASSLDGKVYIYDALGKQQLVQTIEAAGDSAVSSVTDFNFISGGRHVISVGEDKEVKITDVESNCLTELFVYGSPFTCVVPHPVMDNLFLTGTEGAGVQCWDKRCPSIPLRVYRGNFGSVNDIAINTSAEGREFFVAVEHANLDNQQPCLLSWSIQDPVVISQRFYQGRVTLPRLRVSPDTKSLIAQCKMDYILTFNTTRPYRINEKKVFQRGHTVADWSIGLDFCCNSKVIATGSTDGKIWFYNFCSKKPSLLKTIGSVNSPIVDIAYHPNMLNVLACVSADGSLYLYK